MSKSQIAHQDIPALLPHKGGMVLIDTIKSWSDEQIVCTAKSHKNPDNPLRSLDRLSSMAGIEYAAQAMAAHARLRISEQGQKGEPQRGFVAVASKVNCFVPRMDNLIDDLTIKVDLLDSTGDGSLYFFAIHSRELEVIEGQLLVMLEK